METYCCNDTKIFKIFASKPSTFNNVRIKTLPWDLALDQPGRQSAKCNEGHKVYQFEKTQAILQCLSATQLEHLLLPSALQPEVCSGRL